MAFNFELASNNSKFSFSGCYYIIPLMNHLVQHGLSYSLIEALKVRVVRIRCVVVMNKSAESQYDVAFLVFKFPGNV